MGEKILILPVEKQKQLMGCCRKPETRHLWTGGLGPAPVTNMKRNMGAGEKERDTEREKKLWQWWRDEKKKRHVKICWKLQKQWLSNTDHSYTKCEHWAMHSGHHSLFVYASHISRLNDKQTSGVSRGVSRLHAFDSTWFCSSGECY